MAISNSEISNLRFPVSNLRSQISNLQISILLRVLCASAVILSASACKRPPSKQTVTLYTSIDQPVARGIIDEFQRQTGITVEIRTDTEATRTAGLAERLEAEKSNPQADVWWGNEIFHTIRLTQHGVFAPYESPSSATIPPMYKDPKHHWAGTALRLRVLACSTRPDADATDGVKSILDLTHPQFKRRICMANPIAGTTQGHMAALYTLWGPAKFESFLNGLKANDIVLLGGNGPSAEAVAQGTRWLALTDNDDVASLQRQGAPVEMLLPDQAAGDIGTLAIPCTVALVAGAKNPDNAKKLIDYLLSPQTERNLLDQSFAHSPVHPAPNAQSQIKAMQVDYAQVAGNLKAATELSLRVVQGRQ